VVVFYLIDVDAISRVIEDYYSPRRCCMNSQS
jgi:hypothetical protein